MAEPDSTAWQYRARNTPNTRRCCPSSVCMVATQLMKNGTDKIAAGSGHMNKNKILAYQHRRLRRFNRQMELRPFPRALPEQDYNATKQGSAIPIYQ